MAEQTIIVGFYRTISWGSVTDHGLTYVLILCSVWETVGPHLVTKESRDAFCASRV